MNENIDDEKKELRFVLVCSSLLTVLPWIVHILDVVFELRLKQYGLQPLEVRGLPGILTMPFLHGGWEHLISNTPALFALFCGLFLFHKRGAWGILFYLYLISGLLTWLMGRNSTHIGASGLVYAMASFHFVSGVIKKETRQRAFALLVAFLYGGIIWAFFPSLYEGTSISWEGHLSGVMTGIIIAFYYRHEGLQPEPEPKEEDDEEDEEDEENEEEDEKEKKENDHSEWKIL